MLQASWLPRVLRYGSPSWPQSMADLQALLGALIAHESSQRVVTSFEHDSRLLEEQLVSCTPTPRGKETAAEQQQQNVGKLLPPNPAT